VNAKKSSSSKKQKSTSGIFAKNAYPNEISKNTIQMFKSTHPYCQVN